MFGSENTPFGLWVSENTLGYVRVMKHLYQPLNNISDIMVKKIKIVGTVFGSNGVANHAGKNYK